MNSKTTDQQNNGQVVDFAQAREQKLEEKRRKNERIFFKQLLAVYTVVNRGKIMPVELIDVSEDGCAFQIPFDTRNPWPTDATQDIPLRLYFSQDTYLEVLAKIQNSRPSIDDRGRFTRFGCTVDKTTAAYAAYLQFVRFLKLYSEAAHKDVGNASVFYV